MRSRSLAVALVVLLAPAGARADEAEPPPPGARYGHQILVADLASIALMPAGFWAGSEADSAALGAGLAIPVMVSRRAGGLALQGAF